MKTGIKGIVWFSLAIRPTTRSFSAVICVRQRTTFTCVPINRERTASIPSLHRINQSASRPRIQVRSEHGSYFSTHGCSLADHEVVFRLVKLGCVVIDVLNDDRNASIRRLSGVTIVRCFYQQVVLILLFKVGWVLNWQGTCREIIAIIQWTWKFYPSFRTH